MTTRAGGRSGFTLIEILVALTLLAIGILAVAAMQLTATKNSSLTDVMSMGLAVAQNRVELIRTAAPINAAAMEGSAVDNICDCDPVPTPYAPNNTSGNCLAGPLMYANIPFAISCVYQDVCELGAGACGVGCAANPAPAGCTLRYDVVVRAGGQTEIPGGAPDTTYMGNSIILQGKVAR